MSVYLFSSNCNKDYFRYFKMDVTNIKYICKPNMIVHVDILIGFIVLIQVNWRFKDKLPQ